MAGNSLQTVGRFLFGTSGEKAVWKYLVFLPDHLSLVVHGTL